MLTVYSTQGSPGASTLTIHLAAHWASTGREVLLIEADPNGGSLSHNLGVQFTPGAASFVASDLGVSSQNLIDHAQDVLFDNLHVMPAPSSPTGARGVVQMFADRVEELRDISENELAIIVDGGRITAETATSGLTACAAGVVVVSRDNAQLPSLEHLRGVFAADASEPGPIGLAVTVGKSPLSAEEWSDRCDLSYCGAIELVPDMAGDLTAFLARGKRKSRKWRTSLERVGESLFEFAFPASAAAPRPRLPRREAPVVAKAEPETYPAESQPPPAAPQPDAYPPGQPAQYPPAQPAQYPPTHPGQYPPAQPAQYPSQQPAWNQAPPFSSEPQPTAPGDPRAVYGQAVRQPPPYVPPAESLGLAPPAAQPQHPSPAAPTARPLVFVPEPQQHSPSPPSPPPASPEASSALHDATTVGPTGSFRDWAAEIHGVDANGDRQIPPAHPHQRGDEPAHTAGLDG